MLDRQCPLKRCTVLWRGCPILMLLLMSFNSPIIKIACTPGLVGEMRQKQEERESRTYPAQTFVSQLSLNETEPLASIPLRYIYSFKQSAFLQYKHNSPYDVVGLHTRNVFVVKCFVIRRVVVILHNCILSACRWWKKTIYFSILIF